MNNYKSLTQYGECPKCGKSCQPDVVGTWRRGEIEEYAVCCDCELVWSYFYDTREPQPEGWEARWVPQNIETMTDAYECREKIGAGHG